MKLDSEDISDSILANLTRYIEQLPDDDLYEDDDEEYPAPLDGDDTPEDSDSELLEEYDGEPAPAEQPDRSETKEVVRNRHFPYSVSDLDVKMGDFKRSHFAEDPTGTTAYNTLKPHDIVWTDEDLPRWSKQSVAPEDRDPRDLDKEYRRQAREDLMSPYNERVSYNHSASTNKSHNYSNDPSTEDDSPWLEDITIREEVKYVAPNGENLRVLYDTFGRVWFDLKSGLRVLGVSLTSFLEISDRYREYMLAPSMVRTENGAVYAADGAVFAHDFCFAALVLELGYGAGKRWLLRDALPRIRGQAAIATLYQLNAPQMKEYVAGVMSGDAHRLLKEKAKVAEARKIITKQSQMLKYQQRYQATLLNETRERIATLEKKMKAQKRTIVRYEPHYTSVDSAQPDINPDNQTATQSNAPTTEQKLTRPLDVPRHLEEIAPGVYEGDGTPSAMAGGRILNIVVDMLEDGSNPHYDTKVVSMTDLYEDLIVTHPYLTAMSVVNMVKALGFKRRTRTWVPSVNDLTVLVRKTIWSRDGVRKTADYMTNKIKDYVRLAQEEEDQRRQEEEEQQLQDIYTKEDFDDNNTRFDDETEEEYAERRVQEQDKQELRMLSWLPSESEKIKFYEQFI